MIVDRQSFRSTIEPKVHCVWVEAGERNHASSGKASFTQCTATGRREPMMTKITAASSATSEPGTNRTS